MKTQLTLASVIAAGLLASGCSQQMVAQQAVAEEPVVKTVVDCSSCNQPAAPKPTGNKWTHTHPAIPGCTDSTTHTHPYTNRNHKHSYSCKKGMAKPAPRPAPAPAPAPRPAVNPDTHTHPAIPGCTNSTTHTHPNGSRPHTHRYSCRQAVQQQRPVYRPPAPKPMMPVMPKVKAKGTYRGPIQIDGVMQQYQQ